jgi:DNA-binding transcriptional LysR family regulator
VCPWSLHIVSKGKQTVTAERRKLRLGAVSYLNTRPLVYGLEQGHPDIDLAFDLPSRLADQLACGQLDVALIPSIEYFQNPEYRLGCVHWMPGARTERQTLEPRAAA